MELEQLRNILSFYILKKKNIDSKKAQNQLVLFTTYTAYLIFLPAFIYMAISLFQVASYNSFPSFSNYISLMIGVGVFLLVLNVLIGDKSFELLYPYLPIKSPLQHVPEWLNDVQFYSNQYTTLVNIVVEDTIKKYKEHSSLNMKLKELLMMQNNYVKDCTAKNNEKLFYNLINIVKFVDTIKP